MVLALFMWNGNALEEGHKGETRGGRRGVAAVWGETLLQGRIMESHE